MTDKRKCRIALSMGDPAGVGPELLARAAAEKKFAGECDFVLFGERSIIEEALRRYAPGIDISGVDIVESSNILNFADMKPGEPDALAGKAAFEAVKAAAESVIAGVNDAIVTAPVNKYSVNLSGIEFSGHTEMIAEMCKTDDFAMMQSSGRLHVAFVTTHIPIARVAESISVERILTVADMLVNALHSEGVENPRIAVMALNPHAGENGCMGSEDETVTKVAVAELQKRGIDAEGPIVPDVLFVPGRYEKYDGILSMYHDQGHIPFKMLAFDSGVNSTIGLPIIRCSPDHGSAFDIAWGRGTCGTGSFFAAIELAVKRAIRKDRY